MSFLLDTNVVSEWVKPLPNSGVVSWLADADEDRVFLSVVTLAELRLGIENLAEGRKKERLDEWLRIDLAVRFEGRIAGVDQLIAHEWGRVVAQCRKAGRPIGAMDALLAATCCVHDLILVTRNTKHFEAALDRHLNPWS